MSAFTYSTFFGAQVAARLATCNTLANNKSLANAADASIKVVYYHISLAHKPVERRLEPVEDALRRRRGQVARERPEGRLEVAERRRRLRRAG